MISVGKTFSPPNRKHSQDNTVLRWQTGFGTRALSCGWPWPPGAAQGGFQIGVEREGSWDGERCLRGSRREGVSHTSQPVLRGLHVARHFGMKSGSSESSPLFDPFGDFREGL